MKKRVKYGFLLPIIALFLCLLSPIDTLGTEVHQVETEGTVQFTGIYEPIGTPEPTPPDGIVPTHLFIIIKFLFMTNNTINE
ncbi:hypothetical protein [Enterococcus sp. DIV0876]|uniref:hypothetical protein n=1 Tax=Enterococcus sp. DIV0876 TaxID=2774633 RepID=UPI003D2FD747